jgi:hypothetical protein
MEQDSKTVFHVTQNFNAPIGQYVQHIDHQVLHFDENMQMQVLEQSLKTPTQAPERIVADLQTATEAASLPNIEGFRALLTVPYLRRESDCKQMLALITEPAWNNKDRARFALALYESGHVALQRENIRTFASWCHTCCDLLGWDNAVAKYRPSELTPNNATAKIKLYL